MIKRIGVNLHPPEKPEQVLGNDEDIADLVDVKLDVTAIQVQYFAGLRWPLF